MAAKKSAMHKMIKPKAPVVKTASKTKPVGVGPEEVNDIMESIRKIGGKESAVLASSGGLDIKVRGVISTRCIPLDNAIGRGGLPLGRLTILHGGEGSGKTTLALQAVAECQRQGGVAVYQDAECKLDLQYAEDLGVDTKKLILARPPYLEQAFEIQNNVIDSVTRARKKLGVRIPSLIFLDSINASLTKAQVEGEWDDQYMAPQARCYSQLLPKIIPRVAKEDVGLIYISQVREKMNVQYGSKDEIAGGRGPKFYASLIIHIARIGNVRDGEVVVGVKTQAECRKNQIAPPFRKALYVMGFGTGVDNERAVIELALEKRMLRDKDGKVLLKPTAGHVYWNGRMLTTKTLKGLGGATASLRRDPGLFEELRSAMEAGGALSDKGTPVEEEAPKKRSKISYKAPAPADDDEEEDDEDDDE